MVRKVRRTSSRTKRFKQRSTSGNGSNLLWYVLIGVCVAIILAAVFGTRSLLSAQSIDETTLCHGEGPQSITTILLDLTDPLSATQQSRLKTLIQNEISGSNTDTMLTLGIVSEFPERWGAMFAKCKPVTGAEANSLYENPRLISERYRSEFLDPITEKLNGTLNSSAENKSPIMEALQSLVASTPYFSQQDLDRKIIIVSDMLQHSDNLSFYRGEDWTFFTKRDGEQRLAGNLSQVDVEIVRIPRSGGKTPPSNLVEDFWTRYFDRQGSRAPTVTSLGDL